MLCDPEKVRRIKVSPGSYWLIWKVHRLLLKKFPFWRTMEIPDGKTIKIKYFAEGKYHYIFEVQNTDMLLRITRTQFYDLTRPIDSNLMLQNLNIMNMLAERGLSVKGYHYWGGSCLVENAGPALISVGQVNPEIIRRTFSSLLQWSLDSEIVVLDFNEGNWCVGETFLKLVDIDVNYTCSLEEIGKNPIVQRRIGPIQSKRMLEPEFILKTFLDMERDILCRHYGGSK